jgi:hypothetical protein
VTARKDASLVVRVKYQTKDGERQRTQSFNVALFP